VGAQNAQNWTASIVIGIEPKSAQIETSLLSSVSPWFLRALALIVFFFGIGHWP
jgi:hypothetical protein